MPNQKAGKTDGIDDTGLNGLFFYSFFQKIRAIRFAILLWAHIGTTWVIVAHSRTNLSENGHAAIRISFVKI